ncbi:MAG TPA: (p)ppGpp synthetase, partial [Clostridiales bacterium]|nr:(p)ppGpp synthetase [Clostridiales bacterium]
MPDFVYEQLKEMISRYNPKGNMALLDEAYRWASEAHAGCRRDSGEPYIVHPLEVAKVLAGLESDIATIIAGLLHDVIEDTEYSNLEKIGAQFGKDVAGLVDGVTKLARINYSSKAELQAENLRKMLIAMARDIRVILIKLADRLHNMRTLGAKPRESQLRIARETLEIYAPLAHRLGVYAIKWELEDLSLKYTDTQAYEDIVKKVAAKRKERETFINNIIATLKNKCREMGIRAEFEGR